MIKIEDLAPILHDGWIVYDGFNSFYRFFDELYKPVFHCRDRSWYWTDGAHFDYGARINEYYLRDYIMPLKSWTKSLIHIKNGKVVKQNADD